VLVRNLERRRCCQLQKMGFCSPESVSLWAKNLRLRRVRREGSKFWGPGRRIEMLVYCKLSVPHHKADPKLTRLVGFENVDTMTELVSNDGTHMI
jgi:hypothetical protein